LAPGQFTSDNGQRCLKLAFDVASTDGFGTFSPLELSALGGLLSYVHLTQVEQLPPLRPPERRIQGDYAAIDAATRASLEITATNSGAKKGSLLHAVDFTSSGPGTRLLAKHLSSPLRNTELIDARLDAVSYFLERPSILEECRDAISMAPDMARALSRIGLGRGGPRDLIAISAGLSSAEQVIRILEADWAGAPDALRGAVGSLRGPADDFSSLHGILSSSLVPSPPMLARDGGFIAEGFDADLDTIRTLKDDARRIIASLEAQYREKTGVKSLKIKNNNVLGYFIEVTASNADALTGGESGPGEFVHRQTLASAMRFTTGELAELDSKIARAKEDALAHELKIFEDLQAKVMALADPISRAAEALAVVDVACSGARLADEWAYCRPKVDYSCTFDIENGRHPVVEQFLATEKGRGSFAANDCKLGVEDASFLRLVTGPNMAGKSTYLRQNALIAILAQAGLFVPASSAHIGVADRIFSRVGASDDIARGRSTFMVEMIETAAILNQAGPNALVVLDEIGRGTATFDGLSIAWAAVEHLHNANKCRALFATHYHELTGLSEQLPRVKNVSMRVREWRGDVIFSHEVVEGAADRSYGIAVARLAGLPSSALKRAKEILRALEATGANAVKLEELPLFSEAPSDVPDTGSGDLHTQGSGLAVLEALDSIDPDGLSPKEALEALYRLKATRETI
ncbi:MAG: DNA mismatch repair protein MutS, partial [Pseudomonadota bacterium]